MSAMELHYGGQKYQLDPEYADGFNVTAQVAIRKVEDGAQVISARLVNGEFLWLVISRSIPFAVVQAGEKKAEDTQHSGQMVVS